MHTEKSEKMNKDASETSAPTQAEAQRRIMALPPALLSVLEGTAVTLTRLSSTKPGARPTGDQIELGDELIYELEFWHYHILNVMFAYNGDNFPALAENIQSTFGYDLKEDDLRRLILDLNDLGVLNPTEARRHELIKQIILENTTSTELASLSKAKTEQLAAATPAKTQKRSGIKLFRPKFLLKLLRPLSALGMPLAIATVPVFVLAICITIINWEAIVASFEHQRGTHSLFLMVFLGMFTVRFAATFVHAIAAQALTATVEAVVIRFHFIILPRIDLWISDTDKLSRKQAVWLNAAPLIAKLFVTSAALLFWNSTRHLGGGMSELSLLSALLGLISFVMSANPFAKNEGYAILVEFLDEPDLRTKAFKAVVNIGNPRFYQLANRNALVSYGLVSFAFTLLVMCFFVLVLKARLFADFGENGYVIFGIFLLAFIWKIITQLRSANEIYWKNYRFERWREHALPAEKQKKIEQKNRFNMRRVIFLMLITLIIFGLMQPYNYRPSGAVTLAAKSERKLTTDMEGIVSAVYVEGGSFVPKGTLVAELQTEDLLAKLRVRETELATQKLTTEFAQANCDRDMQLLETETISSTAYEKSSATCAVEQAKLDTIMADIERQKGYIERSRFYMPFDGQIGTPDLNNLLGSFLREGQSIATVRDTSAFLVQLNIREVDLSLVSIGAPTEVRMHAYPDRVFTGKITTINPIVDESNQGTVLQIVASIENKAQLLKPGMTGFAKTTGEEMPIWRILTQAIYRFFTIDFWAWLP